MLKSVVKMLNVFVSRHRYPKGRSINLPHYGNTMFCPKLQDFKTVINTLMEQIADHISCQAKFRAANTA